MSRSKTKPASYRLRPAILNGQPVAQPERVTPAEAEKMLTFVNAHRYIQRKINEGLPPEQRRDLPLSTFQRWADSWAFPSYIAGENTRVFKHQDLARYAHAARRRMAGELLGTGEARAYISERIGQNVHHVTFNHWLNYGYIAPYDFGSTRRYYTIGELDAFIRWFDTVKGKNRFGVWRIPLNAVRLPNDVDPDLLED